MEEYNSNDNIGKMEKMKFVKIYEKMLNPITMWKSNHERIEAQRRASKNENKKRKKRIGFVPSVHLKEPLL